MSISALPDIGRISDGQSYLVSGATLRALIGSVHGLWGGENVSTSGGRIYKRPGGSAGYSLAASMAPSSSGGSGSPPHPLQGIDASVGATPAVTVIYGTIAGIIPTIDGDKLVVTPTDITPAPVLTLGASAMCVYAELDINTDGAITAISLQSSNSPEPPASDISDDGSGTAYIALFGVAVTVVGETARVAIADNVGYSLWYQACGKSPLFWPLQ